MKWNSQSLCQWSSCHVRYVLNVCTVGATSLVCLEAWGSVWLFSSVVHLWVSEQSTVYVCMLLAFSFSLFLFTLFLSSISLSLSLCSISVCMRVQGSVLLWSWAGTLLHWRSCDEEVHVEVLSFCMVSSWSRWECQCPHVPWSVYTIYAYT